MTLLSKLSPEVFLRLGLGLTYLYSGYNLIWHPSSWIWAVPSWFVAIVNQVVTVETYLRLQGLAELTIAFILLVWYVNRIVVRIVVAFSIAEFILILVFTPQFFITFRDVGLLGASIALFVMTLPYSKSPV